MPKSTVPTEMQRKMYDVARLFWEREGYTVVDVPKQGRPRGAFVRLTRGTENLGCVVRTSSDRWIAGERDDNGSWTSYSESDITMVVAYDRKRSKTTYPVPETLDIYICRTPDIISRFETAEKARQGTRSAERETWIALDRNDSGTAWSAGSGVADVAYLHSVFTLNTGRLTKRRPQPEQPKSVEGESPIRLISERARADAAQALGLPLTAVRVEIHIIP